MKTGIELIAQERKEQIEKHRRTIKQDVKYNNKMQLRSAAHRLIEICPPPLDVPKDWNEVMWQKMIEKPMKERLIIAGALIAAEIDRLQQS